MGGKKKRRVRRRRRIRRLKRRRRTREDLLQLKLLSFHNRCIKHHLSRPLMCSLSLPHSPSPLKTKRSTRLRKRLFRLQIALRVQMHGLLSMSPRRSTPRLPLLTHNQLSRLRLSTHNRPPRLPTPLLSHPPATLTVPSRPASTTLIPFNLTQATV